MKIVNTAAVVGMPRSDDADAALTNLIRTFSDVLGSRPEDLATRGRVWYQRSRIGHILDLDEDTFLKGLEVVEGMGPHQFVIGLAFFKPLIFNTGATTAVVGLKPDEIADELPGPALRAFMLYLFDLAFTTPGHAVHIGNTAQIRSLVDAYIRMVSKFRRAGICQADVFENELNTARDTMVRPGRLDPYTSADTPRINLLNGLADFYARIRRPFLNDVALKFYNS